MVVRIDSKVVIVRPGNLNRITSHFLPGYQLNLLDVIRCSTRRYLMPSPAVGARAAFSEGQQWILASLAVLPPDGQGCLIECDFVGNCV
jgi:hypothetical protein